MRTASGPTNAGDADDGPGAVGVIGVGRIGTAIVERLLATGVAVHATDVDRQRRDALPDGVRWHDDSAGVLAAADVVITALTGAPELRRWVDAAPVDASAGRAALWIDHTSADPPTGRDAAAAAARAGLAFVAAPVGGGPAAVRAGTATLFAGGDADAVARAARVLRAYAARVEHVGDAPAAYLAKLLVNLLWFGQATLTTEAFLVARRHGVAPDVLQRVLAGSAGDGAFARQHLPHLLAGDYLPDFGLDRCVEELAAVTDAADAAGVHHPVAAAVADVHRAALAAFGPVAGELLGAAWLERQAGVALHDPA